MSGYEHQCCPNCGNLLHGNIIRESYRSIGGGVMHRCKTCRTPLKWDGSQWKLDPNHRAEW